MTIDEAIELLQLYEHAASSIPRDDYLKANELGLEALKRVAAIRMRDRVEALTTLPGETRE